MTLYNLTEDFLKLLEMAEECVEDDKEVFLDTLEGLEGEIEYKAEGCAKVIKELNSRAEGIQKEIDRLTAMKKAINNNSDRIKRSIEQSMIVTGKRKFKTELFSFNIQKNPAKLVIDNQQAIPEEFLIQQEPKVDSKKIKDLLKTETLEYAHLEQTESIRIR